MDNNEFVALKVLILLSPGIFMHKGNIGLIFKNEFEKPKIYAFV